MVARSARSQLLASCRPPSEAFHPGGVGCSDHSLRRGSRVSTDGRCRSEGPSPARGPEPTNDCGGTRWKSTSTRDSSSPFGQSKSTAHERLAETIEQRPFARRRVAAGGAQAPIALPRGRTESSYRSRLAQPRWLKSRARPTRPHRGIRRSEAKRPATPRRGSPGKTRKKSADCARETPRSVPTSRPIGLRRVATRGVVPNTSTNAVPTVANMPPGAKCRSTHRRSPVIPTRPSRRCNRSGERPSPRRIRLPRIAGSPRRRRDRRQPLVRRSSRRVGRSAMPPRAPLSWMPMPNPNWTNGVGVWISASSVLRTSRTAESPAAQISAELLSLLPGEEHAAR